MSTTTPTPAPTPAPTADDHAKLNSFLGALEKISLALSIAAPGVLAPFIKNQQSQSIFNAEVPVEQALLQQLMQK